MTTTDPAVQAVAEAMHADLCPDDECDGSDMGEWDRQAEVAVEAARPAIEREAKAAAWDEGYEAGWWACYDEDDEPRNPYRAALDTGTTTCRRAARTDPTVQAVAEALDKNFNPDRYPVMAAMFMDYAVAAVAAARPLIEAQALRDAADALNANDPAGDAVFWDGRYYQFVADWLRDRADQIEAD